MTIRDSDEVLSFWFGGALEGGDTPPDAVANRWFKKDAAFDDAIRERFGETLAAAGRGELDHWRAAPERAVALIVVLDQFTRNTIRDSGDAFANDARAREAMRATVDAHWDALGDIYRYFTLMPSMHSESLDDHRWGREQFALALQEARSEGARKLLGMALQFHDKHTAIVERFGRYPHRNALLGRETTAEEAEFLTQPGSSF